MSVTYTGDVNFDANGVPLQIGDTGVGSLLVNGGSLEIFDGPANGNGPFVQIGNQAGSTGTVTVTGAGSGLEFIGATFGSGMHVGNEGTGTLSVLAGATLDMRDQPGTTSVEAGFTVGRSTTGNGTFILDDATATIDARYAYMQIGRDGGTGSVDIGNGAMLMMEGAQESYINVGRGGGAGSTGDFSLTGGSVATLNTTSTIATDTNIYAGTNLNIGRSGAQGTALIDASTLNLTSDYEAGITIARGGLVSNGAGITMPDGTSGDLTVQNGAVVNIEAGADSTDGAYINVGRSHGPGTMTVTDSAIDISTVSATSVAVINVARDAATATMTIDNSTVAITAALNTAAFRIASNSSGTAPGADGTVHVINGSTIDIVGNDAFLIVGRNDDVTADLQVLSGSRVTVDNTSGTLGDSGFIVGSFADSTATATIDGAGSSVSGMDYTIVGINIFDNDAPGNGTLTLTNGARLGTGDMLVGGGGRLIAGDSTIDLDPANAEFGATLGFEGAEVRLLAGERLTVNGNMEVDSSAFTFEISADGTSAGSIRQVGDVFANDRENTVLVDPLGGYTFSAGDGYELFATEATTFEDILFDRSLPLIAVNDGSLQVSGQSADFAYMFVESQGATSALDFVALNDGDGTGVRRLDFFATNPEPVTFVYDSAVGAGSGLVGTTDSLIAFNIEQIYGGAAGDEITVSGPDDMLLFGRAGDDTLVTGAGDDVLLGGAGADTLNGGAGTDRAQYADSATGLRADLQFSQFNTGIAAGDTYIGIENLRGSNADDDLRGDAAANRIEGLAGDDILFGRDGNDTLVGSGGDDLLVGGAGADSLTGGAGRDTISYVDATTGLVVDLANVALNTGIAAGDTFSGIEVVIGSNSGDDLFGDAGDNQLDGRNGEDTLIGRAGNDDLRGGNGNDFIMGGAGADRHVGGAGIDVASYSDSASGMVIDLASNGLNTGIAAGDGYNGIENLIGSGGSDDMRGDAGANELSGGAGDDFIFARNGDDTLTGGDGDDNLRGGQGGDILNGGAGNDSANYIDSVGVKADLQFAGVNTGVAAGDSYISVENLFGSNGGDDLRGDGGGNRLIGRSGDDFLTGRDGDDELFGGNGDDVLRGGNGNDTLTGNGGDDSFRFDTTTEGTDVIRDFQINRDTILLDDAGFTSLSAGALSASNFRLTGTAGDADDYVIYDAASGALFYDVDGAGGAAGIRFATLTNMAAIDADDFLVI